MATGVMPRGAGRISRARSWPGWWRFFSSRSSGGRSRRRWGGALPAPPSIKLVFGSSGGRGGWLTLPSVSRHGGEREDGVEIPAGRASALRIGSLVAAPGRSTMVVPCWPPSEMVEGRPLHPFSSAAVRSGWCFKADDTSRPVCHDGGPQALAQLAPGVPSQVVSSPAVVRLAASCSSDATATELDPMAFLGLGLGFFVQNERALFQFPFYFGPLCNMPSINESF